MLKVVFSCTPDGVIEKGPFPSFRLEGEVMRERQDGPVLATHRDHHWQVDGRKCLRLDCDARVRVYLQRISGERSANYGPFSSFSCVDGIAHANHEVFAFVDRSIGDWYCHADGKHYPLLVVEATQ